jgi:hypothetical protein
MGVACNNRLLALCLGTILVVFAQSMFCFAEHAGFIQCVADAEQHQGASSSEQESQNVPTHCCHTHSPSVAVTANSVAIHFERLIGNVLEKPDRALPDGAVREIEYPPQLS